MWDYNTSFERETGQVDYFNDIISISKMKNYWDNVNAMKDFTYTNYSLGHKSCIDHIIMSGCIFDGIIRNNVIYDGDNPSTHNLLFLAVTSLSNMSYIRSGYSNQTNRELCSWNKGTATDIELYKHCIEITPTYLCELISRRESSVNTRLGADHHQLIMPPISKDFVQTLFLSVHSFMPLHANGTNWVNVFGRKLLIHSGRVLKQYYLHNNMGDE